MDKEVADARAGRGHQEHLALNPRYAPKILVFQIAAIRPAIDANGDRVFARFDEPGDVELARQLGILRIADLRAVHPYVIGRPCRADVEDDIAAAPFRRKVDVAPVRPDRVRRMRDQRAVGRKGIVGVVVARLVEAVRLPVGGNGDRLPTRYVEARLSESRRQTVGERQVEPPVAVQQQKAIGAGAMAGNRLCPRLEGEAGGTGGQRVDVIDRRIFPIGSVGIDLHRRYAHLVLRRRRQGRHGTGEGDQDCASAGTLRHLGVLVRGAARRADGNAGRTRDAKGIGVRRARTPRRHPCLHSRGFPLPSPR